MQYNAKDFQNGEEISYAVTEMSAMMDSETPALPGQVRWRWIALLGAPVFALAALRGVRSRRG